MLAGVSHGVARHDRLLCDSAYRNLTMSTRSLVQLVGLWLDDPLSNN